MERQIRDLQIQLTRLKTNKASSYSTIETLNADEVETEDTQASLNACMAAFSNDEQPWFLNSGASSHVTRNPSLFSSTSLSSVSSIRTAAGQILPVEYKGNVKFSDDEVKLVKDILYVPGGKTNILSVGSLADLGHTIMFNSKSCLIYDSDEPHKIFLQANRDPKTKLYKLIAKPILPESEILATTHSS